jgi:SAM-dependent methyltransferase
MKQRIGTQASNYAERLISKQGAWWKRALDVQAPYRWNLRRLEPGYSLEIGCGIGRNLAHLRRHAVGVDHNPDAVRFACSRGLTALLPDEFTQSPYNGKEIYDSLLLSHVAEHMTAEEATALIAHYLPNLKCGGKLILITPQEAGFRSDATHVEFMDFENLKRIYTKLGVEPATEYSFPFPRVVGMIFTYNEFVSVARKPV